MKCLRADGAPFSSTILKSSPVSFSPNSSALASVAVDTINCGSEP